MSIISKAQWPKGTITVEDVDDITEVTHSTRGQAYTMCQVLHTHGFRSSNSVFPIATWVEVDGARKDVLKFNRGNTDAK